MNEADIRRIIDSEQRAARNEIGQLRRDVQELRREVEGMTICGTGFSGSGPNGIMFDVNQLSLEKGPEGPAGPQGIQGKAGEPGAIAVTAVCNGDGTISITAVGS